MIRHLYIHIPFCPRLCPYCSFFVVRSQRGLFAALVEKICAELEWWKSQETFCLETVYFGGGTPSALDTHSLEKLVGRILLGQRPQEVTLEVNPSTVSLEKACLLRQLGVTRISLGVQSFDDAELQTLGRQHSANRTLKTYDILRKAGFDNINFDLIFAIPGSSLASWNRTLRKAVDLQPEHISAYCLTYEEGTPFHHKVKSGQWPTPDPEREESYYELTQQFLADYGFQQYEVSNYCRGEFYSLHNKAYWQGEDFLGLGPGSVSTIRGLRWKNREDVSRYLSQVTFPAERSESEHLSATALTKERLMLGLRTKWGVAVPAELLDFFHTLSEAGLAECTEQTWRLTQRGLRVADAIAVEIFHRIDELLKI